MTGDEGPPGPDPDGGEPPPRPDGDPEERRREPSEEAGGPPPRPDGSPWERPENYAEKPPGEEGPGGIFPSWGWLYGTVLVWFAVTVVALYVLTVTLDFGAP